MTGDGNGQAGRIAASFGRQAFLRTLGARLDRVEAGLCVLSLDLVPSLGQQQGFGHAGVAFTLGDTAAGYAALTTMPEGAEVMTVEMKINLLRPAAGTGLVATGRVARAGRRLTVVTAEVESLDAEGTRRVVALLQGTMIPVEAGA
ncbi:PaaI family thioesterase [Frigidibacter oleivorans]|uniref:PaaI family thioesterase n=1 Tax=Frigidibacter oleivorans TaxID=2487129 RepID=UPI000F8E14C0|nr:PaaI family thioesterase [Frigidibacter oleivorans]